MYIKFKDIVITGVGKYLTRNGKVVVITETKLLMSYPLNFQVNAYGYYEYNNKNGKIKREYSFWQVNGNYKFIGTSSRDIVSKIN